MRKIKSKMLHHADATNKEQISSTTYWQKLRRWTLGTYHSAASTIISFMHDGNHRSSKLPNSRTSDQELENAAAQFPSTNPLSIDLLMQVVAKPLRTELIATRKAAKRTRREAQLLRKTISKIRQF